MAENKADKNNKERKKLEIKEESNKLEVQKKFIPIPKQHL